MTRNPCLKQTSVPWKPIIANPITYTRYLNWLRIISLLGKDVSNPNQKRIVKRERLTAKLQVKEVLYLIRRQVWKNNPQNGISQSSNFHLPLPATSNRFGVISKANRASAFAKKIQKLNSAKEKFGSVGNFIPKLHDRIKNVIFERFIRNESKDKPKPPVCKKLRYTFNRWDDLPQI